MTADPRTILGAKVLRPSLAETWSNVCQEQARHSANRPDNVSVGEPADVGSAFHLYAATYLREGEESYAESEVRAEHSMHVAREAIEIGTPWTKDEEQLAFLAYGTSLAFEKTMWVELSNGWFLRGTLDATWIEPDGTICVRDWKTHRQINSLAEPKDNPQLRLYAYLAAMEMGDPAKKPDVVVSHCFVRYRGDGAIRRYPLTWDEAMEGREIAETITRQMDRAAESNEYQTRPGPLCASCFAAPKCSATGKALMAFQAMEHLDIVGENPQRAAELFHLAGAVKTLLEKQLKAHVEANGPIVVGDRHLTFKPSEGPVWDDPREVVKVLKPTVGSAAWDALSVSKTSIARVMKEAELEKPERAALWKKLEAVGRRETGTRFVFQRVGEKEEDE